MRGRAASPDIVRVSQYRVAFQYRAAWSGADAGQTNFYCVSPSEATLSAGGPIRCRACTDSIYKVPGKSRDIAVLRLYAESCVSAVNRDAQKC